MKTFLSPVLALCLAAALPALAQEITRIPELQIHYEPPDWDMNVSSRVLEEREPRLEPDESLLGDSIRPLLSSGDFQGVATLLETEVANGTVLSPALQHILGQVYMSLEDNAKAEQAFLQAVEAMPAFARAHQRLGLLYLQEEQFEEAANHLALTVSLGVEDAATYGQLAYANLQDHSPWSAINGYQQALLLDPGNLQWQQGLLYGLISARHFAAAQALIDEMLGKDGSNRSLWLQSGNIALNNDEPQTALARLEVALALGGNDPANQVTAAQLHLQHGSPRRAVDLLLASLDAGGSYYETVDEAIGWLVQNEQWQEAERLISAGLANWNNLSATRESRLLAHRGALALAQDNIDAAAGHLTRATDLDPANGAALLSLANLRRDQQQYAQAAQLYIRAASMEAFAERALLGHAQLAIDQRDYRRAVELLNRVVAVNPTRQDIRQNIQALNRIITNEG